MMFNIPLVSSSFNLEINFGNCSANSNSVSESCAAWCTLESVQYLNFWLHIRALAKSPLTMWKGCENVINYRHSQFLRAAGIDGILPSTFPQYSLSRALLHIQSKAQP